MRAFMNVMITTCIACKVLFRLKRTHIGRLKCNEYPKCMLTVTAVSM